MAKRELTYISLFSCAGIGCLGFTKAGFKCIATNELISRRLEIQKYNNKCEREEGYIQGDITLSETKELIFKEIEWWKENRKIDSVDVVVATPPCQGMSIFNHKKKESDIVRNSLVIESLTLVKEIQPKFFVFENVPAFMDTVCLIGDDERCSIREAHNRILGEDYLYYADTINFKLYGSNSSRTRTLVIGVRKNIAQHVSPVELFPDRTNEPTLREIIGMLPPLKTMGEISTSDIYHAFRAYPNYMRSWICDLKEGQSAFENKDIMKRPYKIDKSGNIVENANKAGDKVVMTYNPKNHTMSFDRRECGIIDFNENFPAVTVSPTFEQNGKISLRIFIDRSSIELFGNDGNFVMTNLVFPNEPYSTLSLKSEGGNAKVESVKVFSIKQQ